MRKSFSLVASQRLNLEINASVAEIDKAVDKMLNSSDEIDEPIINQCNSLIEKKAVEIYQRTLEYEESYSKFEICKAKNVEK